MSSRPIKALLHSTGFRLNLWYVSVFTLSALALYGLLYVLLARAVGEKDREVLEAQLREYANIYNTAGPAGLREWIHRSQETRQLESFFVRVVTRGDREVLWLASENWIGFDEVQLGPLTLQGRPFLRIPRDRERDLVFAVGELADGNLLQVGRATDSRETLLEPFRRLFLGAMGPIVVLGFLFGALFAHRTLKPIRQMLATAREIIRTGRQDARVTGSGTASELDELARLFNTMLDRNQKLIRGLRESFENVAHDLRTPLTRLRGNAELALREPGDAGPAREALADCVEETDRVLTMLRTMMDVAEAEAGAMRLESKTVRMADLVARVAELYGYVAEERGILITTDQADPGEVQGDENRLHQALANLVDNAVKYSPDDSTVAVSVQREAGQVTVAVRDEGPGIPEEEQARIWERLYRGDKSRTQRGLGLGLSFVKAVVEAHGGRAVVESTPGEGACFRIQLPVSGGSKESV